MKMKKVVKEIKNEVKRVAKEKEEKGMKLSPVQKKVTKSKYK